MTCRGGAGRQRRMPDDRLRIGMQIVCVPVDDALLEQSIEAVRAQILGIAIEQVAAKSVDGNLQHESWRFRRAGREADKKSGLLTNRTHRKFSCRLQDSHRITFCVILSDYSHGAGPEYRYADSERPLPDADYTNQINILLRPGNSARLE